MSDPEIKEPEEGSVAVLDNPDSSNNSNETEKIAEDTRQQVATIHEDGIQCSW